MKFIQKQLLISALFHLRNWPICDLAEEFGVQKQRIEGIIKRLADPEKNLFKELEAERLKKEEEQGLVEPIIEVVNNKFERKTLSHI